MNPHQIPSGAWLSCPLVEASREASLSAQASKKEESRDTRPDRD
jgi:hypothetical protein